MAAISQLVGEQVDEMLDDLARRAEHVEPGKHFARSVVVRDTAAGIAAFIFVGRDAAVTEAATIIKEVYG